MVEHLIHYLFFHLLRACDNKSQKRLDETIPEYPLLLANPLRFFKERTIIIGPRKRLAARIAAGTGVGFFAMVFVVAILAGIANAQGQPIGNLSVNITLLITFIAIFSLVFGMMRGGTCVMSEKGVQWIYDDSRVFCPWSLFRTNGAMIVADLQEQLMMPINPNAIEFMFESELEGLKIRQQGVQVKTRHVRFVKPNKLVLSHIYEVQPLELGELIRLLGWQLSATFDDTSVLGTPLSSHGRNVKSVSRQSKGWVSISLADLHFPAFCVDCLQATNQYHEVTSNNIFDRVTVSIPLCANCSPIQASRMASARIKRALLSFSGAVAVGAVMYCLHGAIVPEVLIGTFAGLTVGFAVSLLCIQGQLVNMDYLPRRRVLKCRFRNLAYADLMIGGQRPQSP